MNGKTIGLIAIGLWLVTAGVLVTKFVGGDTVEGGGDGRTAVIVTQDGRDFVLAEMRGLLAAVQGVIAGVAKGDNGQVAKMAREVGMAQPRNTPTELMFQLPMGFKKMGMSVHKGFDELADAAEAGESAEQILGRLQGQLSTCVACHATFRLEGRAEP